MKRIYLFGPEVDLVLRIMRLPRMLASRCILVARALPWLVKVHDLCMGELICLCLMVAMGHMTLRVYEYGQYGGRDWYIDLPADTRARRTYRNRMLRLGFY